MTDDDIIDPFSREATDRTEGFWQMWLEDDGTVSMKMELDDGCDAVLTVHYDHSLSLRLDNDDEVESSFHGRSYNVLRSWLSLRRRCG